MIYTIILIVVILYFVSLIVRDIGSNPLAEAHSTEPPAQTDFVPKTLCKFNGKDDPKVYLAIEGVVFDVTAGKGFYGPGGPYENFAGRDASRGLALNSFDPAVLTSLDEPLDTLEGLSTEERESLLNWKSHFGNKYTVVGTLSNP